MSLRVWTDHVVPRLTDVALRNDDIGRRRAELCAGLEGRVLEIGFGSGLNIPHYPDAVTSVSAVEPSDVGWRLSDRRRATSGVPIERTGLDGQHLAEPDDSHDSALSTFSLCSIPDVDRALQEVRRVLRPGGRLHVLEHGLAPEEGVRRWQRRVEPLQKRVFAGCHLTRDMPALLPRNGFELEWVRQDYAPGPAVSKPWNFGTMAVARVPA